MKIYRYDNEGFFVCEDVAQLDPIENNYLIPELSTTIEPPVVKENELAKFTYGNWSILKNYVGEIFYSKTDGSEYVCKTRGEDPTINYTREKPIAKIRSDKLQNIRSLRASYLSEIDLLVNAIVLEDCEYTKEQVKKYRREWLDITNPYKQNPTLLDTLNIDEIIKPKLEKK
jgi:hypothetical protein